MSVIVFNLSSDAEGNAVPILEKKGWGGEMKRCLSVSFFDFFFQTRSSMSVVDTKTNKKVSNKDIESLFFSIV